jgi:hypothetical protein
MLGARERCGERAEKRMNASRESLPRSERKMAKRAGESREKDGANNARE